MVFFMSILKGEVVGAAAAGGWRLAVELIEGIKKGGCEASYSKAKGIDSSLCLYSGI